MIDSDSLTRMGLMLGLLLGIPGLLLVVMRRFGVRLPGQIGGHGRLGVVSRLALDNKHSLVLLRRDSHEQLILIGPAGATVLEQDVRLTLADHRLREEEIRRQVAQDASSKAALSLIGTGAEQWLRRIAVHTQPSFRDLVQLPAPARGARD